MFKKFFLFLFLLGVINVLNLKIVFFEFKSIIMKFSYLMFEIKSDFFLNREYIKILK